MIDAHSLEALSAQMQNVPIEGGRLAGYWFWSKRGNPCDLYGVENAIVVHTAASRERSTIVVYLEDSERMRFIGGSFEVGEAALVVVQWDRIYTDWIMAKCQKLLGIPA